MKKCMIWGLIICMLLTSGCTSVTMLRDKVRRRQKQIITIELDPGHGGIDAGASGKAFGQKITEKSVNLKIAKYLKEELEQNPQFKVYLTRESDKKVELEQRVEKAVKDQADMFISLHNNAKGPNAEYDHGCTVITPTGYYRKNLADQSQLLGCYLLESLSGFGIENRGLLIRTSQTNTRYPNGKLCDYYNVIKNCVYHKLPGVLIEHSFIDHEKECEERLASDEKLRVLAQKDAEAIFAYYGFGTEGKKVRLVQKVTLRKDEENLRTKYFQKEFIIYK